MTRVHAFTDDALADHDAVGLAAELAAGRVSPAELVEAAITRTEAVDPALNAVAYRAFDRARTQAVAGGTGFFAGVPSFLKDNVDVQGMPTQNGSDAWVDPPHKEDGDFARMYAGTGLVVLGKTQLSEFGFSAAAEHPRLGAVRTPWDPEYIAGASSSGSAALVAAGAVPLAHANDGGGSTRIPAAVNGLVGLKPTRGRLAQDMLMRKMPVRIISDGVVTRTVRDTAAFYREAEKTFRNPRLAPIGDLTRPGERRLRVAMITESFGRSVSPEVHDLTLATAALLEGLGHHVEHITAPVPPSFPDDFLLYWASLSTFLVRSGRLTHGPTWDPAKLDNLTLGLARHAQRNLHRLPLAIARLRGSGLVATRFHGAYDVTLTPTLAHATPKVGHLDPTQPYETVLERLLEWVAFTPLHNATGHPAISLPLATTSEGLPLGMMFGGPGGSEGRLIGLAYELERAQPFARIQDAP